MEKSKGGRLREERERLGLSQAALGELGGVRKLTQLKYEQDESSPGWDYFEAAARFGLDVLYVITGVRAASTLSREEQELLSLYQAAPLAVRAAAAAALASGRIPHEKGPIATFLGKNTGQVAETIIGVGMVKKSAKKP